MQIIGVDASGRDRTLRVGDAGPAGGTIVYDAGATYGWGRYIEMAPTGWATGLGGDGPDSVTWADAAYQSSLVTSQVNIFAGEVLGAGLKNLAKYLAQGNTGGILNLAANYTGGGKSDWTIPTTKDWVAISSNIGTPGSTKSTNTQLLAAGLTSSVYHCSDETSATNSSTWNPIVISQGSNSKSATTLKRRPIRYFSPEVPSYKRTYEVNDIGPGGGYVIYKASTPQFWGQYIEAAPYNWAGTGADPLRWWNYANRTSLTTSAGGTTSGVGYSFRNLYAIVNQEFSLTGGKITIAQEIYKTFMGFQAYDATNKSNQLNDWCFPTKDEFNMTTLATSGGATLNQLRVDVPYASSDEVDASNIYLMTGGVGGSGTGSKGAQAYSCRPIRYF